MKSLSLNGPNIVDLLDSSYVLDSIDQVLIILSIFLIQFVSADVYGLFCGAFCDFGDEFEVSDANGEEPRDTFIADITKVIIDSHGSLFWEVRVDA